MLTSDKIDQIMPALLRAQIKIESVRKDAYNSHFKSHYPDLASVIEAVKPALNNEGIVFLQPASNDGDGIKVETRLVHVESTQWIAETFFLPISKKDAHAYCGGVTYARRYSLMTLVGLAAEDDDGNTAAGKKAGKAEPKRASNPPPKSITAAANNTPWHERDDGSQAGTNPALQSPERTITDVAAALEMTWDGLRDVIKRITGIACQTRTEASRRLDRQQREAVLDHLLHMEALQAMDERSRREHEAVESTGTVEP